MNKTGLEPDFGQRNRAKIIIAVDGITAPGIITAYAGEQDGGFSLFIELIYHGQEIRQPGVRHPRKKIQLIGKIFLKVASVEPDACFSHMSGQMAAVIRYFFLRSENFRA